MTIEEKVDALRKICQIAEKILPKIDDSDIRYGVDLISSIARYEHDVTSDDDKKKFGLD